MRSALYAAFGSLFVSLAAAGAVLPLLPSTPFLLLASACFLRSDPRLRAGLYRSPIFGLALADWERNRVVRTATKLKALGLLAVSAGGTMLYAELPPLACGGLAVALTSAAAIVWRLPSVRLPVAKRDLPLPGGTTP